MRFPGPTRFFPPPASRPVVELRGEARPRDCPGPVPRSPWDRPVMRSWPLDAPGSTPRRGSFHTRADALAGSRPTPSAPPTASAPLVAVDPVRANGVAAWTEGGAAKAAGFQQDAAGSSSSLSISPPPSTAGLRLGLGLGVRRVGTTIRWSFGDGGTAEGASVQHTFQQAGTFQVQFRPPTARGLGVRVGAGHRPRHQHARYHRHRRRHRCRGRDRRRRDHVHRHPAHSLGPVSMSRKRFRVARAATAVSARRRSRHAAARASGSP